MDTRKYLAGKSSKGYEIFGNHKKNGDTYIFRLLAPKAKNAYIIGDFTGWQRQKLRKYKTGVFSRTIKNVKKFDRYLYLLEDENLNITYKLDPYSRKLSEDYENSCVYDEKYKFVYEYKTKDINNIYQINPRIFSKLNIFESDEKMLGFISYIKNLKFSHIIFMPLNSCRDKKSLGYTSLNFFSLDLDIPSIEKFKRFIDLCHKNDLGVMAELSLGEFDNFNKSLKYFDFSNMYNYDYDDLIYNYKNAINLDPSKNVVRSFIKSIILYWLREYNMDGILMANLEDIIFWQADINRGVNDDWINLIRDLNKVIKENGKISIGNYNSKWSNNDKLGFTYIYDKSYSSMIKIFQKHPYYRNSYKPNILAFLREDYKGRIIGFDYYDNMSEDSSIAMKMYSENMKFDQLRTLFLILYSLKAKKMIFMADEFASLKTFNPDDISRMQDKNENFFGFYKKLVRLYDSEFNNLVENIDDEILEVEGYSFFAIRRTYNKRVYLLLFNLTDLSYRLTSPYDLDMLISTKDSSKNYKKDEIIKIKAFESLIFKIKK